MNNISKQNIKNLNFNLFLITCFLFGLFPILPFKIKGLPVVILGVSSIYFFYKKNIQKLEYKKFFILSSLFLINILSLIYFKTFPLKNLETTLSLIIIPFFLIINRDKINLKSKGLFLKTYIYSSSVLSGILFVYYNSSDIIEWNDLKVNSIRKAVQEIPLIGDHPIYISQFLAISILLSIYSYKKKILQKKILFTISFFNLISISLLSSKGVIIGLLISVVVLFISKKENIISKKTFFFLTVILLSLYVIKPIQQRFKEVIKSTTYTKINKNNSTSIRFGIYKCTLKTILDNPITGYGFGSKPLKKCYKNTSKVLVENDYNSHNQFLGYFLNFGVIGFLTLLFFFYYLFKIAIRYNQIEFITILVFYFILMLTENILERQSGIILFIFIISFFVVSFQNINLKNASRFK